MKRVTLNPATLVYAFAAFGLGLFIYPVQLRYTRLALITLVLLAVVNLVILTWQQKIWRYSVLLAIAASALMLLLPGRNYNKDELRGRYVSALMSYEGVQYVWGGETFLGVDCSGLLRLGLFRADITEGFRTFNPGLIRKGLRLWWDDCSARSLRDQHHNQTKLLFKARSINSITNDQMEAGDIAVTADGIHVLGYLGGNTWIEADPGMNKVIKVTTPADDNVWFKTPVSVMRWRQVE